LLTVTALALLSLTACESSPPRPTGCPSAQKVADADSLTRFLGESESAADINFQARIYGVYTPRCQVQLNGPDATTGSYVANFQVEFVTRARPDDFRFGETTIGYVIVLMDPDGKKVSQDVRKVGLRVTPDKAQNSAIDTPSVVLPQKDLERADGYRIYVSLVLTEKERAFNRSHPQPWP
jgi:hypothetical protein